MHEIKKGSVILIKHMKMDGNTTFKKVRVNSVEGNMLWVEENFHCEKSYKSFMTNSKNIIGIESESVIAVEPEMITKAIGKLHEWKSRW